VVSGYSNREIAIMPQVENTRTAIRRIKTVKVREEEICADAGFPSFSPGA